MARTNREYNSRYEQITHQKYSENEPIRVAIYGRVSTEHEAQLSALDNQLEWYDTQVSYHPNWIVYDKYVDPGISGTQMKKRPRFLKMLEDAKNGKFDLIFTRETCRFARNLEETLQVTRELTSCGVEVYFHFEDLWTFVERDMDRLVDYARRAQEESQRTSKRVLSGQETSRRKGVLYGNGNILGYRRQNGTYVIEPEQAETVRMIFDLYLHGNGSMKIAKILTEEKRKTASGKVKWDATTVMRTIRNRTYAGMNCYNKSRSNNYLEQKRINNLDMSTYEYVEGDFPPIITDEVWQKAQTLRESRTTTPKEPGEQKRAKRNSADIWVNKLRCNCGKCFRKNLWYTYKDGTRSYGYQCYNQLNNGTKRDRERLGLDTEGYCDQKMIPDWMMDFMAKIVTEDLWQNRLEAVTIAVDLIKKYYQDEHTSSSSTYINAIRSELKKYRKRLDNLVDMRSDGEISKDEFLKKRKTIDEEIQRLEHDLETRMREKEAASSIDFDAITATLTSMVGMDGEEINPSVLEKLIGKVVPTSETTYDWYLNLGNNSQAKASLTAEGRKTGAVIKLEEVVQISSVYRTSKQSISVIIQNSMLYTLLHRLPSRMAGTK